MKSKYRYIIPNGVTFISLGCGVAAILSAVVGNLLLSGALILTSYILDMVDGELARRLEARSTFGLELDSLGDMVSLGAAPAVLTFAYLQTTSVGAGWIWTGVILFPLAGAYRLARFNLLPPKTGKSDSVGLTISTAGATVALAVMSNLGPSALIPPVLFFPLLVILSGLMVSRIAFPSTRQVFGRWRVNFLYIAVIITSLFWFQMSLVSTWFFLTSGYLGFGVARAGYRVIDG